MIRPANTLALTITALLATSATSAQAQQQRGATIGITRASASISVDGEIGDPGWQNATRIETFYETNPGDNIEPPVKTIAYTTYDDRAIYFAFECFDPDMKQVRAPFGDRDSISGNSTDFAGVIIDAQGDGKAALELFATARGIQFDAVQIEGGNEDASPDFFWDSAAKIKEDRWVLEMRIPFSSLRYSKENVQEWGIIFYRNYPRDRRFQIFSAKLPRGGNCFLCNFNRLTGLERLPTGGKLVVAPYVTLKGEGYRDEDDRFTNDPLEVETGLDAKWTPNADTAVDITLNPDFSQVESDVAIISANERFAIFLPEKRPFFLEGVDLFDTPMTAVYTRTMTTPKWGTRITGQLGDTAYTALVVDERGGGSVILPGPSGSNFAEQDFQSFNLVGRARHTLGDNFASFLVTARQIEGGGHNRVYGPDFRWQPTDTDTVSGQLLFSDSETPNRPELAEEWNGQKLSSQAGLISWAHSTSTTDWFIQNQTLGDDFRADLGFIPQVGISDSFAEYGRTFRPKGFFNRVRLFAFGDYTSDSDGRLIFRQISPGAGMNGRWNSFMRFRLSSDKVRASDDHTYDRTQFHYTIEATPTRKIARIGISGTAGDEIDFAHGRVGDFMRAQIFSTLLPTDHLELRLNTDWRSLDVEGGNLFTARVERLRATYTFSAKSFVRVIAQNVRTDRDPDLYAFTVPAKSGNFSLSALYAYKLNWQTVFFFGLGDVSVLDETDGLEETDRSMFLKVSYAWQK